MSTRFLYIPPRKKIVTDVNQSDDLREICTLSSFLINATTRTFYKSTPSP